jgi:hypothetical protein
VIDDMLKLLASTGVGFNVSSDFFGAIVNADDIVISAKIASTMRRLLAICDENTGYDR